MIDPEFIERAREHVMNDPMVDKDEVLRYANTQDRDKVFEDIWEMLAKGIRK